MSSRVRALAEPLAGTAVHLLLFVVRGTNTRRKKSATSEMSRPRSSHHKSSPASSKTSLPYPSFSKAHSKESVAGDVPASPFTPNPTDLASQGNEKGRSPRPRTSAGTKAKSVRIAGAVPPSPPLTSLSEKLRHQAPASETHEEKAGSTESKAEDGDHRCEELA